MSPRGSAKSAHGKQNKSRRGAKGRPIVDSVNIPAGVQALLDEMMPNIAKLYPERTCCEAIGLDWNTWENYCTRYPALRIAIKRMQALKKMELQDKIEQGDQGWQSAATLLERLDSQHFARGAQGGARVKATALSRALGARKK